MEKIPLIGNLRLSPDGVMLHSPAECLLPIDEGVDVQMPLTKSRKAPVSYSRVDDEVRMRSNPGKLNRRNRVQSR